MPNGGRLVLNLFYEEPDPDCPVAVTPTMSQVTRPYFLKVSHSELGQAAAVVCRIGTEGA